MRSRTPAALLAVVAASLALATPVAAAPAPAGGVADFLRQQQAEHRIPGLAYAVVDRDGVVDQAAWGVDGNGAEVTGQTPFLLGSVSKPFTAQVVVRLADAGRIGLDDPVRRHLPWFRLADDDAAARVTVRHALTHTTGLPQWASRTDRFDNSADGLARSVRDLATVEPSHAPGGTHTYSDANYMILGALVEAVTGEPFGTVLRREVFEPLGMRHASATEPEAVRAGLPAGHRYAFGQPRRFDPGYDTSGAPYGYVAAALDDLVPFVRAHLSDEPALTRMHTGQVDTGNGGRYGLGWRETTLEGTGARAVWHAGATPGYFAHVVLVPGSEFGVVVLANSYSPGMDAALAALGFAVTRMSLGEPPSPGAADPLLSAAPYAMAAVAVLLAIALARQLTRLRRPARPAVTVAWVGGYAVLAAAVLLGLPPLLGGTLGQALLWTPDIAWAVIAVAGLAALNALVRLGAAVAMRTGQDSSLRERSPT